ATGAERPGTSGAANSVACVVARPGALPAVRLCHDAGARHPRPPALPLLHLLSSAKEGLAHLPVEVRAGSGAGTLRARPDCTARAARRVADAGASRASRASAANRYADRLRRYELSGDHHAAPELPSESGGIMSTPIVIEGTIPLGRRGRVTCPEANGA